MPIRKANDRKRATLITKILEPWYIRQNDQRVSKNTCLMIKNYLENVTKIKYDEINPRC